MSGRERLELGALDPTRDFNFVTDTAAGLLALGLCKAAEGQVVNIGSGEEWSIAQTVELLCEIAGRRPDIALKQERVRPVKSEVNRLLADNTKICELTGWKSKVPFREGLKQTVKWIEKNLQHFAPDRYAL